MTDHMQCRVRAINRGHVVAVEGEVDMASAPRLAETLVQFAYGSVIVDLTHVTYIDSSGLNALTGARRLLEGRGSRLIVQGVTPFIGKLFEISGLADLIDLEPIRDEVPAHDPR